MHQVPIGLLLQGQRNTLMDWALMAILEHHQEFEQGQSRLIGFFMEMGWV